VIRYEPAQRDFDYDTDYTRSIHSQLQEVLDAVAKRQKEEGRSSKAEARRTAAEAKARAKAEKEAAEREEQARRQEADRRAAEEARAEAPPPEPEPEQAPAPPAEAQEAPTPAPPPVRAQRQGSPAATMGGEEGRRTIRAMMGEETSPVAPARAQASTEERPVEEVPVIPVERQEELVVEANKVVTIVTLTTAGVSTEYRRVAHKWGDIFYFKDGKPCSELVYRTEAMGPDRLVSAGP
ncbi:MAG: hypothetical protein RBT71_09570, partial [Flavobacteriales bacterium]|jgi:hypothetical protein|nr:hypothetical protein [Flavobacteriales bacterium]